MSVHPFHSQQNGRAGCINFHSQQYGRAGGITFHQHQYRRAGCVPFHSQQYGRAVCRVYILPLPAVWTCRVCSFLSPAVLTCREYPFFKCRNVGLSGIQSFRYRNEQKRQCRNLSGTGIRGSSPVPKCSGTRMLRYRTDIQDTGMPMLAASTWMPMPSYVN
jgi:hypothetical protein